MALPSSPKITWGSHSVPRVEDPALLAGRASFVDDIDIPGTLAAAFVRSPFAHAALDKIDKSAALNTPGVHAVYTLEDLRPHLTADQTPLGQSISELVGLTTRGLRPDITPFILARDEVCYVGDPIAVVIADDRYLAEDAASRVAAEFHPLAAVSDCREAAKPGAALVHRRAADNILVKYVIGYGDCQQTFAQADHVFDLSLVQHRGCAHPL
jgi:aerobic carbon-monoxide dehydrogenase large subunit